MGNCGTADKKSKYETKPPAESGGPEKKDPIVDPSQFITKRSGNYFDDFVYVKELGKGSTGEVVHAIHKKSKKSRAVKIIPIGNLNKKERKRVKKEVKILKKLDHPNIMRIHEYYEDKDFLFIIGELYEGGGLLDKIVSIKHYSEATAASIFRQILSAVNYCHKKKIIHRDLKLQNILFDTELESAVPKIIDFGACVTFDLANKEKESSSLVPIIHLDLL